MSLIIVHKAQQIIHVESNSARLLARIPARLLARKVARVSARKGVCARITHTTSVRRSPVKIHART